MASASRTTSSCVAPFRRSSPCAQPWPSRALEDVGLPFNAHESFLHVPVWTATLPDQGREEWEALRESLPSGAPLQYAPDGIKVVGNPLGTDDFSTAVLTKRADKIIAALPKLQVIRDGLAHFILLKYCINARFRYNQRCSPARLTAPIGARLDDATLSSLCQYLRIDPFHSPASLPPPTTDLQASVLSDAVIQLRLPIKQGGAGLTSVEGTSVSAFYCGTATTIQWLARTSDEHRALIPNIPDLTGPVPTLLADLRAAHDELARAGAEFITPAQAQDPNGLPLPDPGVLRCPSWETLKYQAPPPLQSRPLYPVPRQKSVTAFLLSALSPHAPSHLSQPGRERVARFAERSIPNMDLTGEDSPIFDKCLHYQAAIRSNNLAFLCFTPGTSAVPFPWHFWRLWFAHLLGLPIPVFHEDARNRINALGVDPTRCECGRRSDLFGHHRLCCLRALHTTASRYDAHDSIRDEIIACAHLGNLGAAPRAPTLPGTQQRGDLIIRLSRSYARGAHGPARDQVWDQIVGDVNLVHPRHRRGHQ